MTSASREVPIKHKEASEEGETILWFEKKVPRAEYLKSHTHKPLELGLQVCDQTSEQQSVVRCFLQVIFCSFTHATVFREHLLCAGHCAVCRGNNSEQSKHKAPRVKFTNATEQFPSLEELTGLEAQSRKQSGERWAGRAGGVPGRSLDSILRTR